MENINLCKILSTRLDSGENKRNLLTKKINKQINKLINRIEPKSKSKSKSK